MEYIALGCMSGTSLDGIDCSLVKSDGVSYVTDISNEFIPYSDDLQLKLHNVILRGYLDDIKVINQLNQEYKDSINNFIKKNNFEIDLIAMHGQTVYHDQKTKISIQLFDKSIRFNTNSPVICNFRKNDLLNGGNGAPIMPEFHRVLANQLDLKKVIFVNIGGVTNITLIDNQKITAGDSSFGNAIVNDLIYEKTKERFDVDGSLSNNGQKIDVLFNRIISDKYFLENLPKSLDRNYFHKYIDNSIKDKNLNDLIYTLLEVIPFAISSLISSQSDFKIILMGGGRKNLTLQKIFSKYFDNISLIDNYQIDGDFIESQGMALLGIRYMLKKHSTYYETTKVLKNIYLGEKC
jgi:anhydro-N-acetylmuramic acid kinase